MNIRTFDLMLILLISVRAVTVFQFDSKPEISASNENRDRVWLRFMAQQDEGVYGGGEQYSHFNLKGKRYEMLTREQGMGRNATEVVSFVAERVAPGSRGEFDHSYWPQVRGNDFFSLLESLVSR